MATITLNIDVDNEQFKGMCIDSINDLPKEKTEEIFLKAVEAALMQDTAKGISSGYNILVTKEKSGYYENYVPTELLKEVISKIDTAKYIEPIAELVGNYIKDNYKELVSKYMVEQIASLLFSPDKEYSLRSMMRDMVSSAFEMR